MLGRTSKSVDATRMHTANVKQAVCRLIADLPDDVSWDEVAYRVEVRASIERGMAQVKAGDVTEQEEIEKRFGVTR